MATEQQTETSERHTRNGLDVAASIGPGLARAAVGAELDGDTIDLRRLGSGGHAVVFKALDTVEGVPVALKVPCAELQTPETLEDFLREIRIALSRSLGSRSPSIRSRTLTSFLGLVTWLSYQFSEI